jgi:hypothetical protein
MRFTADYDSEEDEFPVGDVSFESSAETLDYAVDSSDEDQDEIDGFIAVSSPRASHDAWVMPNLNLLTISWPCIAKTRRSTA